MPHFVFNWTVLFICVSSVHILSNKAYISMGMQIWYSLSLMLLHGEKDEGEVGGKQDICPLTHIYIVHQRLLKNWAVMAFPFPNLWYCDSFPPHRVASGRDNMLDFSAFKASSLAFHCVLSVASNQTGNNKSWTRVKDYKYANFFLVVLFYFNLYWFQEGR